MENKLFECDSVTENPCQLNCKIYINKLFKSSKEKENFENKKQSFLNSLSLDKDNKKLFVIKNNYIKYKSEELIPARKEDRVPLLLMLGNPAIHSIQSKMFFSFEKDRKRHRFWKMLDKVGIFPIISEKTSVDEQNEIRKRKILESDYDSPFQIGLTVFHSMPSSASDEKWSGVKGIHKLLGIKALRRLEQEEKIRALDTIKKFVAPNGAVIVFQKNAWENLKSVGDPTYKYDIVRQKGFVRKVDGLDVELICVPPTRLSGPCARILKKHLKY